ncbi:MAG: peptidylprolyl isomerase [Pseudomonadota bacterium]
MKRRNLIALAALLLSATFSASAAPPNPRVKLTTSMGVIIIELDRQKAPVTVKNFLQYVRDRHYDGTIFHRVMPGFMIQGGGFVPGLNEKPTRAPIRNEADNGLSHVTGTIAMARTPDPHSASAQFFINVNDNDQLNHSSKTDEGWGYAVFGRVVQGMDVVMKIVAVQTADIGPHEKVPVKDVVIRKVEVIK